MPEPKKTRQHQEPGKEKQYTQDISLPNPTSDVSGYMIKNRFRPRGKCIRAGSSLFVHLSNDVIKLAITSPVQDSGETCLLFSLLKFLCIITWEILNPKLSSSKLPFYSL